MTQDSDGTHPPDTIWYERRVIRPDGKWESGTGRFFGPPPYLADPDEPSSEYIDEDGNNVEIWMEKDDEWERIPQGYSAREWHDEELPETH